MYRKFKSGKYEPSTYVEVRNSHDTFIVRGPRAEMIFAHGPRIERHQCRPEDVDRYQGYLEEWQKWGRDRQLFIEACWKDAIGRPCSRCKAKANERCKDLRVLKHPRQTIYPHEDRLSEAFIATRNLMEQSQSSARYIQEPDG